MNAEGRSREADPFRIPVAGRWLLLDRAAVLVVGLCAGFLVGLSFVPAASPPVAIPQNLPVPSATAPAAPKPGIDPRVVQRVARSNRVRVGVFGDSFAIGIWDAMYLMLPGDQGYEVLRFGKEGAGFTRYRVDNLEQRARAQLAADPVDVAVITMGVNDAEDMWEGRLYPFMSEPWKQVVGERVDALVRTAGSTGARVYWIGLPAMRDPALDAKVRALNQFFEGRMAKLGVTFIDTRPLSVDDKGRYASHLAAGGSGAPRLVRTGDGIHMIGIGYQRIVAAAVKDIGDFAARARRAAARPAPAGEAR